MFHNVRTFSRCIWALWLEAHSSSQCWDYNRLIFVTGCEDCLVQTLQVCVLHTGRSLFSVPHKQCSPPLCHSPTKAPATHIAWLAAPSFSANPSFPVLMQTQRHFNNLLLYVLCAFKVCILKNLRPFAESCRYWMDCWPTTAWSQT